MFVFRKICRALFSCNTRSEIRLFAFLPTQWYGNWKIHVNSQNILDSVATLPLTFIVLCKLYFKVHSYSIAFCFLSHSVWSITGDVFLVTLQSLDGKLFHERMAFGALSINLKQQCPLLHHYLYKQNNLEIFRQLVFFFYAIKYVA